MAAAKKTSKPKTDDAPTTAPMAADAVVDMATDTVPEDASPPRHKDFGPALRVAEMEPLSFELCDHTFHCFPAMTSRKLLNYARKADGADGSSAGETVYGFMEAAILPDQREEWNALLDDDEYVIDISLISDVVSWLVEQYSGRPTLRSSPS